MDKQGFPLLPVLLVDDEDQFLQSGSFALRTSGITNVIKCNDSRKVMELLEKQKFSVIILDLMMPYLNGDELLKMISSEYPSIPVIMHTAVNEVKKAVECMKNGAYDYLTKPIDKSRLVTCVRKAIEYGDIKVENQALKESLLSNKLTNPQIFESIVTRNKTMFSVFQYIEAIAKTSLPVLINGDTGVGKEMISKAVHQASFRKGEFVSINVAGLDDNMFSDTLFGHMKGAFTGAVSNRPGLIEQASGGTLFLDEIGDLKMESQIKLLRLLEENTYYPVGSDKPKNSQARIVVATNVDLQKNIEEGKFRKDLFYRLQNHQIRIPALKDRKEDIPILVEHFMEKASNEMNKPKPTYPKELNILLSTYHFPGNIRELRGMIYDVVSRHTAGVLSLKVLKDRISESVTDKKNIERLDSETEKVYFADPLPTLKEIEKLLLDEALKRANNNQTIAAQMIGLTRSALNKRLNRERKG